MEITSQLVFADAIGSEVPDGHVANNNNDCLEVPLYLLLQRVHMKYK